MSEIRRKNLSNFFGEAEDKIQEICASNIKKSTEATLDDDESSNNSIGESSYYNNLEYESYYDLRILYDSWDEFENLREDFRENIPEILKNTDCMRNIFLSNENDDIRSKSPFEDDFKNSLRILVKNNNEPWVIETSRIIINALRGVDATMNMMKLSLSVEESEELYMELAYGIIINVVLETRENMGDCEINRLCYFKCTKCDEDTTYLFNEKEHQDICATCWNGDNHK